MKHDIIKALVEYDYDPFKIDRLIVSCFLKVNSLTVRNNSFLLSYLISEKDTNEYKQLQKLSSYFSEQSRKVFDLEDLLELFEFVISPKEKVVTGAVYTPQFIRKYIVDATTRTISLNSRIADISCGCGGFLITIAKKLKSISTKSFKEIFEDNLWGLDIAEYSIIRTKIILSLLALLNGEDVLFKFNLYIGNALNFKFRQVSKEISENDGFDIIVGNPPYVCSRNIDDSSRALLDSWQVTKSGHPDLYIPFFEIAIANLKQRGTLGYITVNTFFKSVNGRALREYFSREKLEFKIIDFRNEQVFKKRNTYTCICFITKVNSSFIEYVIAKSSELSRIKSSDFSKSQYSGFDNKSGWNFGTPEILSVVNKIERFEEKIFSNFSFSTGIATLKNDIYKFSPIKQDNKYYYFKVGETTQKIEKGICREIINANKVTIESELWKLKEKVIFPYQWSARLKKYELINESSFKKYFPYTYAYLLGNKQQLGERDKGNPKVEAWYAYGRSQGLNVTGIKLFLPHIAINPSFVLSKDKRLLFYNGEAILSTKEYELTILKKILESEVFWYYIFNTSKPYSSGYFSMSKNYLKKFSIPPLSKIEKDFIYKTTDKQLLSDFILKKYDLSKNDALLNGKN